MRHYYTDPLAAAWMAKHFGMIYGVPYPLTPSREATQTGIEKIICRIDQDNYFNGHGYPKSESTILIFKHERNYTEDARPPFYIHPDSLHLLEPQDGDLILTTDRGGTKALFFVDEHTFDFIKRCKTFNIIQRNGIPFMWPESEEI